MYTPHTALDTVSTGINTWLGRAFFDTEGEVQEGLQFIGEPIEDGLGGSGRVASLKTGYSMGEVIRRVKKHLGLQHGKLPSCSLGGSEE